ncbi:MAG: diguanylate cyclase [Desulfomonile tiedjei]|uniref:diguanylate cyclase n=1 Tax=Desulfomonile tiedjei TaxID=2358 RepID=A0A9D6V073_9BACT|nr:diguanylate cyclase [Desulfomonile tiedjei]
MDSHIDQEDQQRKRRKGLRRREYRATAFLLIFGMLLWLVEWGIDYYAHQNTSVETVDSNISTHKILLPMVWMVCFLGYGVYVTRVSMEIQRVEKDLEESEERYRLLTRNSITGIYIHLDGRLVYVNGRFEAITGFAQGELLNRSFWDLVHPEDRSLIRERDIARAMGRPVVSQSQFRFLCKHGEEKWVEVLAAVLNYNGLGANMGNVADISDRKQAERQREELISDLMQTREALQFRATHDGLTGVLNRAAVFDALERETARAIRENRPLAVVMADVDHFKAINDSYGHLVGDAVLKEITRRISESVRPYDVVGRYGGEELVIALPGCDESGAYNFAERVRTALCEKPIDTSEGPVPVTISLGAAVFSGDSKTDADALIRSADSALYAAKEAGRNCVRTARISYEFAFESLRSGESLCKEEAPGNPSKKL